VDGFLFTLYIAVRHIGDTAVPVTSVDAVVQRKMVGLSRNRIFRRASHSITAVLKKLQHV
jgi:hypothetical protein